MTLMPWTPMASMVFRSAWMPAPPPESEPATVSTRGGVTEQDYVAAVRQRTPLKVHADGIPAAPRAVKPSCTIPPGAMAGDCGGLRTITVAPALTTLTSQMDRTRASGMRNAKVQPLIGRPLTLTMVARPSKPSAHFDVVLKETVTAPAPARPDPRLARLPCAVAPGAWPGACRGGCAWSAGGGPPS